MTFSTFGPFELHEMTALGIDQFYGDLEQVQSGLQNAIGVYIVAYKDETGKLVPAYVGKTNKGFGARLKRHFDSSWIWQFFHEKRNLSIFLIARVTENGKLAKTNKPLGLKSIARLELFLIGSCLLKNTELLNKQEKVFHSRLHVPGYWNSPVESRDKSAKKLAAMLGTRN